MSFNIYFKFIYEKIRINYMYNYVKKLYKIVKITNLIKFHLVLHRNHLPLNRQQLLHLVFILVLQVLIYHLKVIVYIFRPFRIILYSVVRSQIFYHHFHKFYLFSLERLLMVFSCSCSKDWLIRCPWLYLSIFLCEKLGNILMVHPRISNIPGPIYLCHLVWYRRPVAGST